MKVSARNVALLALGLLLLALGAAWWLYNFERVEREVDLSPRGEAAYNPLYALKLALRASGVQVRSRQRLQLDAVPPGRHDTLLLLGDPRTLSDAEVAHLLAWVEGGGHLLVRTPGQEGSGSAPSGALLDALQLQRLSSHRCMQLAAPTGTGGTQVDAQGADGRGANGEDDDRGSGATALCGTSFTLLGVEPVHAWGDLDAGYVYARIARGQGTVDLLAGFGPLTNNHLEAPASALLARQLLQPGWKQGTVHLVYAASMPPLWRLLLGRAWMAWLPALLALAAWLWMRSQRFGPALPSPEPARRALLEHVQASGEHLWRYGRGAALYAAVHAAFLARLRRRDPLAAALEGPAQAQAIARRTGAPAAEVARALQPPRPSDGAEFRNRIAFLLQLRQQL